MLYVIIHWRFRVDICYSFCSHAFWADKIPEIAKGLGKMMREVKNASNEIKREIKDSSDQIKKDLDSDN